jgi:hypothetical protein
MGQAIVLVDSGKVRIEMEQVGARLVFRPFGTIDEDVNFSIMITTIAEFGDAAREIAFDVSQVSRMNSCGVREWVLLMERLASGKPIVFTRVGSAFLEQANIIPNLFGKKGTPVQTFEAPYFCSQCDKSTQHWIETAQVKFANGKAIPPSFSCETCAKALVFDWDDEEYFNFMKRL